MRKIDVIAIDGPSGSGKSSIAKILSEKTGYEYISTGAMYRLIGLLADENGIFHNEEKIKDFCEKAKKIQKKKSLEGMRFTALAYKEVEFETARRRVCKPNLMLRKQL